MEKVFYSIGISADKCFVDIRINDYPIVFKYLNDDDLDVMFQVNHAILQSGPHELTINVLPVLGELKFDESAKFCFSFTKSTEPETDDLEELVLASIESEKTIFEFDIRDEMQLLPVIHKSFEFETDVPYTLNAWQNSVDLTKIEYIGEIVRERLRYMQFLVERKQYDKFFDMLDERNMLQCQSKYKQLTTENKKSALDSFVEFVENGFKLQIPSEHDKLMFFGNGRLACFKDENGDSPVKFVNENGDELQLEIFFHQRENSDKLTII